MVAAEGGGRGKTIARGRNFGQRHILLGAAGLLMLADLYLMLMVAPTGADLGPVERVIFFHVPIAIMSFLAFFLVFLSSIVFLVTRNQAWDRLAHASAEVGVVFVTLALITGVIWARPIWNTWWTLGTASDHHADPLADLCGLPDDPLLCAQPPTRTDLRRGGGHCRFRRCPHRIRFRDLVAHDPSTAVGGAPGRGRRAELDMVSRCCYFRS